MIRAFTLFLFLAAALPAAAQRYAGKTEMNGIACSCVREPDDDLSACFHRSAQSDGDVVDCADADTLVRSEVTAKQTTKF